MTADQSGRVSSPDDECKDGLLCAFLGHYEERCPSCKGPLTEGSCHFTYTTWRCLDCGANLDSRVVMPESVHR